LLLIGRSKSFLTDHLSRKRCSPITSSGLALDFLEDFIDCIALRSEDSSFVRVFVGKKIGMAGEESFQIARKHRLHSMKQKVFGL
jgi:hypothetical protein